MDHPAKFESTKSLATSPKPPIAPAPIAAGSALDYGCVDWFFYSGPVEVRKDRYDLERSRTP